LTSGEFYSKGKFLLSGEYFVLYGAKALAVPLKFGQLMTITELPGQDMLKWETYILDNLWFTANYNLKDLTLLNSSDEKTGLFIQNLLKAGGKLQPELQLGNQGYYLRNNIDFSIMWGLGSSSSLVSNMAYWLDVDPYKLYRSIFKGSGYDVFCARAEKSLIYQLHGDIPEACETYFKPSFSDHLYFVYSGRKQDSQESVNQFKSRRFEDDKIILEISDLTDTMLNANTIGDFMTVMLAHEEALSSALGLPKVKEELFPDFPGEIKSLGAWGGDFVMAATDMDQVEVKNYFSRKNLEVVFKWDEIVF
jgi:mevalonate kinase